MVIGHGSADLFDQALQRAGTHGVGDHVPRRSGDLAIALELRSGQVDGVGEPGEETHLIPLDCSGHCTSGRRRISAPEGFDRSLGRRERLTLGLSVHTENATAPGGLLTVDRFDVPAPISPMGTVSGMENSVPRWLQVTAAVGWRLLVVGAVAYGATIILAELRVLIIPAILSLFVGCLATPVSERLKARGLGRLPTTLIVFVGTALAFTGVVWFISSQIANSVDEINESIDEATVQITDWLAEGPFGLTEARIDELIDQARQTITDNSEGLIGGLAGGAATVLEIITGFLLMLVFVFFIVKDGDRFWTWAVSLIGNDDQRRRVERIGQRSWVTLRNYLGGTALVGLADAVLIGIGLLILGVPLVVPLALLVFFGAFFPLIGATISGAVAVLVALATVGVVQALILAGIVLAVQRVEGDILMPILIGKAVDMHPLLIIVALTIGFIVAGLIGGFLAVPILAVGIVVVKDYAGPSALPVISEADEA